MNNLTEFINGRNELAIETAKQEIRKCNEFTAGYGLELSEEQITELVECRKAALKGSGRVEFGGGILPKLIYAFYDSPYMDRDNYETTLADLQEAFYFFKSESLDRYTDDELIEFMVSVFNGRAQGSAEYLTGTSLSDLCRYADVKYDSMDADEAGDLF